mgnify:FL=1
MARADCGAGEYLRLRRFIRDRRVGALRSHFDDRSAFQGNQSDGSHVRPQPASPDAAIAS